MGSRRKAALQCRSKGHCHLIRTGLSACIAHSIGVVGMAMPARGIGVEARIARDGGNARPVAVNVDAVRSRSAPRKVHRLLTPHFVATRGEADLSRGRR